MMSEFVKETGIAKDLIKDIGKSSIKKVIKNARKEPTKQIVKNQKK